MSCILRKTYVRSSLGQFFNIVGKTKDTVKTKFDMKDLGIKEELQFREDGEMPSARYTLSTKQKEAFCKFLQELKFPDGFASNISRCVNADGTKIQGLKTHPVTAPASSHDKAPKIQIHPLLIAQTQETELRSCSLLQYT